MNRIFFTLLLSGMALSAAAQLSETREVGSFQGITAAEGIDVYLKKGDREAVRVEVGGNTELSNIVTEVSGTYLKIHVRDGRFTRNINARVFVTYKAINKISASSAANIYADGVLNTLTLQIECASAASIELVINSRDVEVSVSSAGDVELEGTAKSATFSVVTAGELDAYDLEAEIVTVEGGSAGTAKVHVLKELYAEASSGASIRFRGNPSKSRTDSNSGGSVKKSY